MLKYPFSQPLILFYLLHFIKLSGGNLLQDVKSADKKKASQSDQEEYSTIDLYTTNIAEKLRNRLGDKCDGKDLSPQRNENSCESGTSGKFLSYITNKYELNDISVFEQSCNQDLLETIDVLFKDIQNSTDINKIDNVSISEWQYIYPEEGLLQFYFLIILDFNVYQKPKKLIKKLEFHKNNGMHQINDIYWNFNTNISRHFTSDQMQLILPLILYKPNHIEKATLTQSIHDLYNNKTRVKIRFEIDTKVPLPIKNLTLPKNASYYGKNNDSKFKNRNNEQFSTSSIYFGSFLALISSFLCGISFAIRKKALCSNAVTHPLDLLSEKLWWTAHLFMIIGDILHFLALHFAPAIIACTIQVLTVLVAVAASSKMLDEKMNKFGKLALALSLGGCTIIVIHAPNEPHIANPKMMLNMLTQKPFVCFFIAICIIINMSNFWFIPRWANVNSLPYTLLSAIYGSVIVIALKGAAMLLTGYENHWFPWICFAAICFCLVLQLELLHTAQITYSTLVVTTQYYVMYSACVIIASSLMLNIWKMIELEAIAINFSGFIALGLGVFIFTIFQEDDAMFHFPKLVAGPEINNE